uniref:Major capsid protein N-terminal domain-containing protein n=1 Tax=viral metagenome TaxID=1070528 RepID=A0A6C0CGQ5_9ZZZZ
MGGLMQLVAKGAQDILVCGNPSFTHFRSVYKRHTDFAMEHFQLVFQSKNLQIPQSGTLTLRAKVEQFAQLVNDCYLILDLPNIYSPVVPIQSGHTNINQSTTALGYDFQWINNIGYNIINYVAIVINGQEVVRHTGEWMKLYANLNFDPHKKALVDQMVGNVPAMYDPANAYGRVNQYPSSIYSTSSNPPEPSIYGRSLNIPLHFWFCEDVGSALPIGALQYSVVEIVVELKNMYQLFTVIDNRDYVKGVFNNTTFNTRIAPDPTDPRFMMNMFLSPPVYNSSPVVPTIPDLTTWRLNPYIEANYIFLSDAEMAHVVKTEHSFIINQVDVTSSEGQYGPSNDLLLLMRNLCTQVVWVVQRNDRAQNNDYDNYTNWTNAFAPPIDISNYNPITASLTSGNALPTNVSQRDSLIESTIVFDGLERFGTKPFSFFSLIQHYRHYSGQSVTTIPGVYSYSFSLDHYKGQPSGHVNGSMINKVVLRNTYIQPPTIPPNSSTGTVTQCVLKSTLNLPNPTVVNPNQRDAQGNLLYGPNDVVTVVVKGTAQTNQYTYNVRAFVESYNYLRITGGIANVVFSS